MSASPDNICLTVEQIVEEFSVTASAVRRWIAAGLLEPVKREGQGRSGRMYFSRGAVGSLVYGLCPICCQGFRKATLKQAFCSQACRQKSNRLKHSREGSSHA